MKTIIKNNYKLFIYIGLIILLLLMVITNTKLANYKNKKIPEVKLKENVNKAKSFAIMIQNENGYEEYKNETWPNEEYKFKEAKCVDNNGALVDKALIYENNKVTLITNQTIYCTLYFDKKNIIDILRENDLNKTLSNEIVGGMYRYQGVGSKEAEDETHKFVNSNYICFGTKDKEECLSQEDKYMYRIIGVSEDNKLKLLKKNIIVDGDFKKIAKNQVYYLKDCGINGINCIWPETLLFKRLNGLTNGSVSGSGFDLNIGKTDGANTNIFLNSKNYPYLNSDSQWNNIIEDYNWPYGDIYIHEDTIINNENIYGIYNNGLTIYQIETGLLPTAKEEYINGNYELIKYSWNDYIKAKIGLMYLHDYFLAYDNFSGADWLGKCNNCLNNWIHNSNNGNENETSEWIITTSGVNQGSYYSIYEIHKLGYISAHELADNFYVRPVFYVKNDIQISGKGTIDNPFIINF